MQCAIPVPHVVPSHAALCLGRPAVGTASAKQSLAAAAQPGTVCPVSRPLASVWQEGIAEGHCRRNL